MAPPPPPGLMDDLIGEILLRFPPDDPACLVRASLTCKKWRSFVLDAAFHRQYRAFHRTPPVLGFFHDEECGNDYDGDIFVPHFVPTTTMHAPPALPQPAASAGPGPGRSAARGEVDSCRTLDCRHGRVLLHTVTVLRSDATLTVWDPVTGHHKSFSPPSDLDDPYYYFAAAVLCASDGGGCDHIECSRTGGPFLVVIAGVSHGMDYDEAGVAWARVYSSETAAWSAPPATLDLESIVEPTLPSLLAAGALYFMLEGGRRILKYDLAGGALSVMDGPPQPMDRETNMIFAAARDGELGVATVEGYCLHLWSCDQDEWTRVRVIELDAMIPISMGGPTTEFDLGGFAKQTGDGGGLIFISANDDRHTIFTIDLKSGRITNTGKTRRSGKIFPLTSFYTPWSLARAY